MIKSDVANAFKHELRTLQRDNEFLEALPHVTRRSRLNDSLHDVAAFALSNENVEQEIRDQIEYFRNKLVTFEWKVFSWDEPSDLISRLAKYGFEVGDLEKLVVFSLAEGIEQFKTTCKVQRVDRLDQLSDFRSVAERVFRKDYGLTAKELESAIHKGDETVLGYIAYVEGIPAGIGRMYTHPRSSFAGLYGGGTLEEFRGRGVYQSMIAARAVEALRLGAQYLQVDALPTSLPILQKMGFEVIADTWPCELSP